MRHMEMDKNAEKSGWFSRMRARLMWRCHGACGWPLAASLAAHIVAVGLGACLAFRR